MKYETIENEELINFALDLWENYLIYNIEELWSRNESNMLKPLPNLKDEYHRLLEKLSDKLSIAFL